MAAASGAGTLLAPAPMLAQVHQKHRVQRAISRTTAQPCDAPPREPVEGIRSGIALGRFRQHEFQKIDQGYPSPSTLV